MDVKVLRIQNKNLSERLLQRKSLEIELRDKIEKLQNRKVSDDSKMCIFDRYWTQLDEDLRIIFERFETTLKDNLEGSLEINLNTDNTHLNKDNFTAKSPIRNFLSKLNDWDKFEIEENLKERVKFTTETVAKLVINYER